MNTFSNIRIANEILNIAESNLIEPDYLVEIGDQWLNDSCHESISKQFPELIRVMMELDMEYDRHELEQAFSLLLDVASQHTL